MRLVINNNKHIRETNCNRLNVNNNRQKPGDISYQVENAKYSIQEDIWVGLPYFGVAFFVTLSQSVPRHCAILAAGGLLLVVSINH